MLYLVKPVAFYKPNFTLLSYLDPIEIQHYIYTDGLIEKYQSITIDIAGQYFSRELKPIVLINGVKGCDERLSNVQDSTKFICVIAPGEVRRMIYEQLKEDQNVTVTGISNDGEVFIARLILGQPPASSTGVILEPSPSVTEVIPGIVGFFALCLLLLLIAKYALNYMKSQF